MDRGGAGDCGKHCTVSGSLTIAGVPVADTNEAGALFLMGSSGDRVDLPPTSALSYSVAIIPGAYDLYYSIGNSTGAMVIPRNTQTRLRCFNVQP